MATNEKTSKNGALSALGHRIRSFRMAQGISQVQLADSTGMSPRYLSEVEAGRRNISYERLEALARNLSVPLSELLSFEQPQARAEAMKEIVSALDSLPLDQLLFVNRILHLFKK